MNLVKVIMLGSQVKEYEISNDPTVGGLIEMMEENDETGKSFDSGTFTRGSVNLDNSSPLRNGDTLHYAENLKGNQLSVKIIRIGAAVQSYAVNPGSTIRQVLEMLPEDDQEDIFNGGESTSYEIRIGDGQPQSLDTVIPGRDGEEVRLILTKRIKGNE